MRTRSFPVSINRAVRLLLLSLLCFRIPVAAHAAQSTKVLYSFTGDLDGGYPDSDLVFDSAGNLYGMAVEGGTFGAGTVFQLSPAGNSWKLTVFYNFTGGIDGGQPYGGVTLDREGNIYGTAVIGGIGGSCPEDGCGVVWKLAPGVSGYTQTIIHSFQGGADGYGPGGPVVFDELGSLYGLTATGGAYGLGIIYQVSPDGFGGWRERVIHDFTGGSDGGSGSAGRLLIDSARNIFGVATTGGDFGHGTVFELTPASGGGWNFATLYAFHGQPDAGYPYGGLVADASGNLYGTTYYDGAYGLGCVYRLSLTNGVWTETVLHSFQGGTDGIGSIAGLVPGKNGSFFGTTSEGGLAGCGCGTIFRIAPRANGSWKETVTHRFEGSPDGAYAYSGLVADAQGNFYGATVHGGIDGEGAIFKLTP